MRVPCQLRHRSRCDVHAREPHARAAAAISSSRPASFSRHSRGNKEARGVQEQSVPSYQTRVARVGFKVWRGRVASPQLLVEQPRPFAQWCHLGVRDSCYLIAPQIQDYVPSPPSALDGALPITAVVLASQQNNVACAASSQVAGRPWTVSPGREASAVVLGDRSGLAAGCVCVCSECTLPSQSTAAPAAPSLHIYSYIIPDAVPMPLRSLARAMSKSWPQVSSGGPSSDLGIAAEFQGARRCRSLWRP